MRSREVLRKVFESILSAYVRAYPEKPDLRCYAEKIDDYLREAEIRGGKVVRAFVEDLKRTAGEEKDVYVDLSDVLSELRRTVKDLEMRRREFASKLISKLSSDEITKVGVEAHKIAARIFSVGIESYECPACLMNNRKSKLMNAGNFHLCPVCFALYVERDSELSFVHRLSEMDIELAIDLLWCTDSD